MKFDGVYIIMSADIVGSEEELDGMDPTKSSGRYPESTFPALVQTEGNEQYDYGYLGDAYAAADPEHEGDLVGDGRHRKWAGELSPDEWQGFASRYMIDLDDDGLPERYEETMGSITEYGHLPALSVNNTEGWDPTDVIDSSIYVSFATYTEEEAI